MSRVFSAVVFMLTIVWPMFVGAAEEEAGDDVVPMIVELVTDPDPEIRALGLQQVREAAKGAAATKRFAELLVRLSPAAQAGLIDALAARGDKAARPAVLPMLGSDNEAVQASALRALGWLGEPADVPALLAAFCGDAKTKRTAARASLVRLPGQEVNQAIAAALRPAKGPQRLELLNVLVERAADDAAGAILAIAADADAAVRAAAVAAMAKLAGPAHVAEMVALLLKTEDPSEREAWEKTIMFACGRAADASTRADPLLAAMAKRSEAEQTALLPALGRVGGPKALKAVEAAIASSDTARREAGVRALCNWPDASVAPKLLAMAQESADAETRIRALRALMRVSVLADERSDAQRLALLKQAMGLATRDEDRKLAIDRAKAVRTIESLGFVEPFLDDPALAQQACATVVELAHHKGLREPNKPAFDKALDKVMKTAKDPKLIDRADRYKTGRT